MVVWTIILFRNCSCLLKTSTFMDLRPKRSLNYRTAVVGTKLPSRQIIRNDRTCIYTIQSSSPHLVPKKKRNHWKTNESNRSVTPHYLNWSPKAHPFPLRTRNHASTTPGTMMWRSANGSQDDMAPSDCEITLGHNCKCDWSTSLLSWEFI